MVIAVRSRLLCIAALVTSLGTMCFADTLRVMSFNVRYPAKGDDMGVFYKALSQTAGT